MMFVYFVQKQGFLDKDRKYLRNKLHEVQSKHGDGRFQHFYREFLLKLFHEGLGQPEAQRKPDLVALLGKIPFLNGGLFDVHDLEHNNPDISIPDKAFERVFAFFEDYQWHLDERRYREDDEINPDVMGYIFEKYVNQKEMGAYYQKEMAPTTPRRTSPAISPAMRSSRFSSTPQERNARWLSRRTAASGDCCGVTLMNISTQPSATA